MRTLVAVTPQGSNTADVRADIEARALSKGWSSLVWEDTFDERGWSVGRLTGAMRVSSLPPSPDPARRRTSRR